MRLFTALAEGLRFLYRFRRASRAYWQWRLGTVYGSFNPDGTPRSLRSLFAQALRDRVQVSRFLVRCRGMRRAK